MPAPILRSMLRWRLWQKIELDGCTSLGGLRHPSDPVSRADLAATKRIEFETFFGTDTSIRGYTDREFGRTVRWDTPLTTGYRHTFLAAGSRLQSVGAWTPAAKGIRRQFGRFRPDVVLLTAYAGRFHLGALMAAHSVGAKIIIRHEASDTAVTRTSFKSALRDWFLR